jgi:hypothetical protein
VIWSLALFLGIFPVILTSYFYYVFKNLRGGPDMRTPLPPLQIPSGMGALEDLAREKEKR